MSELKTYYVQRGSLLIGTSQRRVGDKVTVGPGGDLQDASEFTGKDGILGSTVPEIKLPPQKAAATIDQRDEAQKEIIDSLKAMQEGLAKLTRFVNSATDAVAGLSKRLDALEKAPEDAPDKPAPKTPTQKTTTTKRSPGRPRKTS